MIQGRLISGIVTAVLLGMFGIASASNPVVVATNPPQHGLNASKTASIEVEFDVDMDETTINNSNFTVNALYSGRHMGSFVYDSPGRTVTFTSDREFQISEVVTVTLTTGIKSLGGEPLSHSYAWSFTVEVTNGLGVFDSLADYSIDAGDYHYRAMAAADFDNDGDIDLAASKVDSLVILDNQGDASFSRYSIEMPAEAGKAVCAADFNNDGYMDLVTSTPAILLNTGTGSFMVDSVYDQSDTWFAVYPADFNGDGTCDFAISVGGMTWIYLNLGDGTMSPEVIYDGGWSGCIIGADFDNDWDLDLAVRGEEWVAVLFNNGDGEFSEYDIYPCGEYDVFSMCAADIDGEGDMDIIIANMQPSSIAVLINNGDGSFMDISYIGEADSWLSDISVVDFDADGRLDIAAGNAPVFKPDRATAYLWWNMGNGDFVSYLDYHIGWGQSWSYVFVDLDGDADIDMAMRDYFVGVVTVHLNLENPYACGDANSDGNTNVADAVFLITYVFQGGPAPDPLCEGDANGDGNTNIADAVYLINYVFQGGPPPVVDCCL